MNHIISDTRPLILASASPRRTALLGQTMIPFLPVPSRAEEGCKASDPERLAVELALRKAAEVGGRVDGHWILGADTLVAVGEEILGKPEGAGQAERMLELLSGKEHRVVTGFAIIDPDGRTAHMEAPVTTVRVKKLSEGEIRCYTATGEPMGKAGAYAVQGIGAFIVEEIRGSYTNVVGLPLFHVIRALTAAGALSVYPPRPGC